MKVVANRLEMGCRGIGKARIEFKLGRYRGIIGRVKGSEDGDLGD
jgi:hypothetical protein